MRKKRQDTLKRKRKKRNIIIILVSSVTLFLSLGIYKYSTYIKERRQIENENLEKVEEKENKVVEREIIITAAGDCTLGTDTKFSYSGSFLDEASKHGNDYSHFMKNVRSIFENDDYTIVNLETTFTESEEKAYKGDGTVYHFKGPREFVNILTSSSIEGVTIANNHIYDYGKVGFDDTVSVLKDNNVDICGEGYKIIKDIKGIKFGFLGYQTWSDTSSMREKIYSDIEFLKDEGCSVVIPYFHWGIEREHIPYDVQRNIARFAIDSGADLVLGSHPHVIQSLENYKGKMIVYSLGNFSFGGNFNPKDKRTFIFQIKMNFSNNKVTQIEYKVIPTMISSVSSRNDYVPTIAVGEDRLNILNKLNEISDTLEGKISDEYFKISSSSNY